MTEQFDQLPPHDADAEQALIGSMMLCDKNESLFVQISADVTPEDFFSADNGILCRVMKEMRACRAPIDAVTVRAELDRRGLLDEIGGTAYLAIVLGTVPSACNGPQYAKVVRECARLREMIAAANQMLRDCYGAQAARDNAGDVLQRHIDHLAKLRARGSARSYKSLGEVVAEACDAVESGGTHLLKTGFHGIDSEIGGVGEGEVIIVAARPSMGKSTFLRTMARNLGESKTPIGFISLEESAKKIGRNLISAEASIENRKLRTGDISMDEWQRVAGSINTLSALPVYVASGISRLADIKAMMALWKARYGIRLVIVDYLQLISGPGNTAYERVTNVSRELACLVRELGITGVFAAQINRAVESRDNQRPRISDLKESGQIEQDADVILLLHREDYYHTADERYEPTHELEVIIGKARDAVRGRVVRMQSDLRYQRFTEAVPAGLL